MKENAVITNQVELSTDFSEMYKVEELIDSVCSESLSDQDVYGNVLIAVTEAVNNAIIHGNKNDKSKSIVVRVLSAEDAVTFSIKDEGRGFDFENLPDSTAPENLEKENGRGIFLMKSLSDAVEFSDGGSQVSVSFLR